MTLYFYAGLGWVTAERLSQPDVAENEAVKDFDCNPKNSRKCSDCPHNQNFSDWQDRLPCGQWHCWVDVTIPLGKLGAELPEETKVIKIEWVTDDEFQGEYTFTLNK